MARPNPNDVNRIACVGAGAIGGGWAAFFLARGMDVAATDPGPDAEARLRQIVDAAWPSLEKSGLEPGASRDRLRFTADLDDAVAGADFIQESAPDDEELKMDLFRRIDAAAPADVVIASSSSRFLTTRMASRCAHPERCILGHPFAPSYLLPLVEVMGGERTDPAVVDWTVAFYEAAGKVTIRLRKEIEYYVANRLQQVVGAEMHRLVEAGICDYRDVDAAMVYGPGLRWAFAGPLMCANMAGGQGGIRGSIAHWGWHGPAALEKVAIGAVDEMTDGLSMDEIEAWRDDNLLMMLKALNPLPGKG
jgi:carnitine 3-dehydrogenase